MPHLYDLMMLLDPNAPDERHTQIVGQVQSMIEGSGNLVGAHDWGLRKMAYEIDHRGDAHYHLFQFEGENPLLEQLDHTLKITDGVLRFRIFKVDPDTTSNPPPAVDRPSAVGDGRPDRDDRPRRGRRDDRDSD